FYARSGDCGSTDRKLTQALAVRVKDMILNSDFGKMPVIKRIENNWLQSPKTKVIALADIRNFPLPDVFYNQKEFNASHDYSTFIRNISESRSTPVYDEKLVRISK
ncbi:MAG TPA: hypothetical protein VJ939_03220, partial [Bacteroidales bacterium]|nr:hypothetical protein [Bacteroidales bacterium]